MFPYLCGVRAGDRATEFKLRCVGLEITRISLHSYRYAWAERALKCGFPERFAQQALGHNSKAVHRAYAKHAEVKFLAELTAWMDVNSEGIYATRPWKIYGEGPSVLVPGPRSRFGGAKDFRTYTPEDIRFTSKGSTLFAFVMAWPETRNVLIKSLALNSPEVGDQKIAHVSLLGYGGKVEWSQTASGLTVKLPEKPPSEHSVTLRIKGLGA